MDAATRQRQERKIAEWLGRFLANDRIVQISGLSPPVARRFVRPNDSLESIAAYAADLSGRHSGVYWTLNPLSVAEGSGSRGVPRVGDFAARHWLFVDVEAPNHSGRNASEAEKAAAKALSGSVLDTLKLRGFAGMVWLDSGNGYHLYVPVDLPNDGASRDDHKKFLQLLAARFDLPTATIDTQTSPIDRKGKVPYTLVRRADPLPDRPYRWAVPVETADGDPREHAAANTERFRTLLEQWDDPRKKDPDGRDAGGPSVPERAKLYLARMPEAVSGTGGHDAAFAVALVLCRGFALTPGEARPLFDDYNERCKPPWSDKEIEHKLADARASDKVPLGYLLKDDRPAAPATGHRNGKPAGPSLADLPADELIDWANSIEPRPVEWLWPNRVPLAKLTTFAGITSVGKTFALLDIAARVTKGSTWPCAGGECAVPGKALFISAEDEPDDTLVPRLIELGADLTKVAFLKSAVADRYTIDDIPLLEKVLAVMSGDVRLVAIDPPTAFLGDVDDHKNSQLRRVLSPLKSLAARHRIAIVFITHFNKPTAGKMDALMRVMGSVAWVNAVRSAHVLARDPEDPDRRLFVPLKTNVGPEVKGLTYRLVATDTLARIEWGEEVDLSADDAVGANKTRPRALRAADWLAEQLERQNEWSSIDLFRAAAENGMSRNAMFEAQVLLGLPKARKTTDSAGNTMWYWWVPPGWKRPDVSTNGKHEPVEPDAPHGDAYEGT
jgi:hypothetical protein